MEASTSLTSQERKMQNIIAELRRFERVKAERGKLSIEDRALAFRIKQIVR